MKKSSLTLAMAAAFGATPVLGQTVDQKLEILQQEIDDLKAQARKSDAPTQQPSPYSLDYSSMLDRSSALANGGTNIVGYGEVGYSKFRQSGNATADLQRFVFGFNHRFDERLTLHSEVEFEHAIVSKDDEGEAEIEQAWVNYKIIWATRRVRSAMYASSIEPRRNRYPEKSGISTANLRLP